MSEELRPFRDKKRQNILGMKNIHPSLAEEYASIEEAIQKLIDEKAKVIAECVIAEEKSRLEELAEEFCEKEVKDRLELKEKELTESYSNKIEEFKKVATEELQTLADKYVTQEINEAVSKKEAELNEKFEEKVAKLEESVLDNLDKFLELEITSKIDNSLLESVAKYKAHEPIIEGILSLFENNLVALPQDGAKQIDEAKAEVESTKAKLNESISEKIQLQSKIDTLKTGLLIAKRSRIRWQPSLHRAATDHAKSSRIRTRYPR
jgi:hypothetical protein